MLMTNHGCMHQGQQIINGAEQGTHDGRYTRSLDSNYFHHNDTMSSVLCIVGVTVQEWCCLAALPALGTYNMATICGLAQGTPIC
jgi:hypothetical protein